MANLNAQKFGNEWINFSQKHYRMSIPKTGLYRIDSLTLANSGIPLNTINPKNFQLFIKGIEQHILINGENDDVFNTSDYIEFYAEKNDCSFDSLAYTNILNLPNPYFALFNDTNYAYLTWNNLTTNKRVAIETDANFASYTPANYYYSERILAYNSYYSVGQTLAPNGSDPRYVVGEGYGAILQKGESINSGSLPNFNVYQSPSLPVYIRASFSGITANLNTLTYDHQIRLEYTNNLGSLVTLNDTTFFGFKQLRVQKQITSNLLQNSSSLSIRSLSNPAFSGFTNKTNVHYLYIKYPQVPDFNNTSEQLFFVDNSTTTKTFLDISNVSAGGSSVIIYDLTNHKYINAIVSGSNVKALIPNALGQKKCFLTTSANIINISKLSPANETGYFVNYLTSNPDSAFLIISHRAFQSSANDYKTYRESPSGGSNNVIMANIEELYEQFAYGNTKNPLAIKNFCRYLSDKSVEPPKYLLLLGKSIQNEYVKTSAPHWNACSIPTMGVPSSDNLLTTGIHGANSLTPFIPVGRISAKTNAQVTAYLNKVKTHELTLPNHDEWRKRVLHFAGGTDLNQQTEFQRNLLEYENIIKEPLFGGKVFTFKKNSLAPIQLILSDSITTLINNGASLITFFGHGSINGFDQAIDDPVNYNNKDKYPVFIANSCYSGNIHTLETSSTSEDFTLINEKGSIAFIASSSTGYSAYLSLYTTDLYRSIALETYEKGIGDAVKNSCLKNSTSGNIYFDVTCLEMTLEGDPSIRINAFSKPDYEIKNTSVFFNTTSYVDSIGINIHIKNLGRAIQSNFIVKVQRYFANGDSEVVFKKINAPFYQDTVSFFMFKDYIRGIGLNQFKVNIDCYNEISELLETNNSTTGKVNLFVEGDDIIPVFPYQFAIIPKTPQITLKASTANPFARALNYRMQIDTSDVYSNPIKTEVKNSTGGVVEWTVDLPYKDSTVYFWRVSKEPVSPTDTFTWRESSFQVIGTKNGWSQAHFHQFKNNGYQFVNFLRPQRKFDFFNNLVEIGCKNAYSSYGIMAQQYSVNNGLLSNWHFAFNGWSIAVFDSVTAIPWITRINGSAGFAAPYNNCLAFSDENRRSYDFGESSYCGSAPAWQTDLLNFLNSVPINNHILAYSSDAHKATTYSNLLYQAFESFGSNKIRTVNDSLPMIIFGKKRAVAIPGSAIEEVVGTNNMSKISITNAITTKWDRGFIESPNIGPSNKWNSLHWNYINQVVGLQDSIVLKLIGIRKSNGNIDTLATFYKDKFDVNNLYDYVDASLYPTIKLVALMKNNILNLAPQLKKWQVIYDQVPECAINPVKGYFLSDDTLQEGDKINIKLPIENIGALPFNDSLVVTYYIEDINRISHFLPQHLKVPPFVSGQIIIDTITLASYQYPGLNYLWVDVNPPRNKKYQLEQYHFNNIARIPFVVVTDKINPLLDVTFDGVHIMNGDIVSAKPHILITLKDENKFLALNDTADFALFTKYPKDLDEKRLYFANIIKFTPAQLPNNSCKIEWMPKLEEDGKYFLRVQAADRAKNISGASDYSINFEVINKQTVTEVLNYPNPFSTSTRFVFTLTGSEVPDKFIIQIMTITGKVVREITRNELSDIHIGRNITDYAWDGKDDFGDKLANGVYLYRVITRHNGEAVEKNTTIADYFFKKGFGKMVIIR